MNEFKEVMAKDAAKVFTPNDGEVVTASAALIRGNDEIVILLIECPDGDGTYSYETMLYTGEIERKHGFWSSRGQWYATRREASANFDEHLEHYKKIGFVFPRYED